MTPADEVPKPVLDEIEACKLDAAKLHHEVTQIVSQRFQLTLAAIVLFSTVCGWITSRISERTSENIKLASASSILLVLGLAMLYLYFNMLLRMMRIYTVYLDLKHGSQWERDWKEYRRDPHSKKYTGYSKAGGLVFFVLGLLSFLYPLILVLLMPVPSNTAVPESPILFLISLVITCAYLLLVWGTVWGRHLFHSEKEIKKDWMRVFAKLKGKEQDTKETETDDLTIIEGIGAKTATALVAAGFDTFEKLAQATPETLQDAGIRSTPSMSTWAEQAAMAANGDWDGLKKLQAELRGGRQVENTGPENDC